jgi:protein-S-isoprenylcysteine O-methyltransferase Ste14
MLFRNRSFFPIPLLIGGYAIHLYNQMQSVGTSTPEYYYPICFAVGFMGLLIRINVIGYAARNTSGRNTKGQVADIVNTTGFYSIVRHPLYLGNFLMWLGAAMLTAHPWFLLAFVLGYWLYYERIMFAEEAYLTDKFGDSYTQWANGVPAFIPKLKGWIKPSNCFSYRKALRREHTGLLNLTAIFFIFRYTQAVIRNDFDFFPTDRYSMVWYIGLGAVVLFYISIRALSKRTNLLKDKEI